MPTSGDAHSARASQPLLDLLGRLDMRLEGAPTGLPDCELLRFAPGTPITAALSPQQACLVVCAGFVLRRGPGGSVPKATAVVGPDEALPLADSHATQQAETLTAITAVELAVIDASALRAQEAGQALLSELVVGPQSIACIRCWARFGWIAQAQGAERLRRALVTMAQRLGAESPLLADVRLELDALAAWLAMPPPDAIAAATLLQAQGLITVRDEVLRAVHPRATGPAPC